MKEQESNRQERWLLSSYDFNNGFWRDKKETFNCIITTRQGEQTHAKSGEWTLYHFKTPVAKAQETVLGESGLPVMIITLLANINPEDKEALLASLKHYQAQKEVKLKF